MTRPLPTTKPSATPLCLVLLLLSSLAAPAPLSAATAGERYTEALSRERGLRAPDDTPATLAELRSAMERYEEIVRQYPRSGYSDNALWQAAGLAIEAFERHGEPADQRRGERLLQMLAREYPSSSLVPRVATRLAALAATDGPLATIDAPLAARQGAVSLRSVTRETLADLVRVTLELEDEVEYFSDHLNGPARLYFDFGGTDAATSLLNATLPFDDGDVIREIRLGQRPEQTTRVVIDMEGVESYSVYQLYSPYRLVVDSLRLPEFGARAAGEPGPAGADAPSDLPTDISPVEPVAEPVVEPVAEPMVEPVAEPVVEPVAEPVVEPVAEPVVEPVAEPVVEPVAEPMVEPVAEPVVEPVAEFVTEPVSEAPPLRGLDLLQVPEGWSAAPVVEPVAEPVVEPVAEPMVEPVAEPVVEPVAEPMVEPVAEPVVEPVAEPVVEPVAEFVTEPVSDTPLLRGLDLLPVPEGWSAEPLAPMAIPERIVRGDEQAEEGLGTAAVTTAAVEVAAAGGEGSASGDDLAWPAVHDLLYPGLGSPPLTSLAEEEPVLAVSAPEIVSTTTPPSALPLVVPPTPVAPMSLVSLHRAPDLDSSIEPLLPVCEPATPAAAATRPAVVLAGAPLANVDGAYSLGRQLGLGISRIVIDPGHGGYDPGARSGELTESALVLDVAERLETRLLAEGIEVVMTRRQDVYVPLRARTELANRVEADLFLSIHANAADDPELRGIETYYLDFAADQTAQAVAARENAASGERMHDLPNLVRSIAMDNKFDESRDLAKLVQRNLVEGVRELRPDAQDLGVKQAPFMVLIGATMPSVLTEISFLSNQEAAAYLAMGQYRDQIADALFSSIVGYQRSLKPAAQEAANDN